MSTSQSRRPGPHSTYTPPDPLSFLSFLYSPFDLATQLVTSKRTHLNLLRLGLLSLLGIASLIISAGGYGVLWFSWGKVSGWEGNMQLHYGTPASPPHSLITLPDVSRFSENQAYDVFVDLTLPVTRSNVNLGNFMVHLSLLPAYTTTSVKTGKPSPPSSILFPPPLHSSTLPTLLAALPPLSPFNLLSLVFHTPKKTITLKMLDGVVLLPSSRKPAETVKLVRVWVGREDLWKSLGDGKNGGSGKEVVTLGGKVRIVGKLSGIRALLAHHPLLSLLTFTTTSLLTTLFFSLLAFYLLSPTSSTLTAPSPTTAGKRSSSPLLPSSAKLNLSRAREREWAAQLPRGMGDITGEGAGGLLDSSEEERMLKREEEEEEEEWERLKGVEAGRIKAEEERERLEDEAAEEVSSGEETAMGGRAVEVKREEEEDEERSLLGGSGTTPSHRSWGASTSRSSAPSGSSASTRPSRS